MFRYNKGKAQRGVVSQQHKQNEAVREVILVFIGVHFHKHEYCKIAENKRAACAWLS